MQRRRTLSVCHHSSKFALTLLQHLMELVNLHVRDQQLWPTPLWAWLGQDLFDCWANSIRTVYNASTGSFGNRPGETVKPFPPSNNGDYPPPDNEPPMDVKFNVTRMPFDWRLPLSGLTQFYIDMKALCLRNWLIHLSTAARLAMT
eukprot:TRINITY_DN11842_c0_g1_i17.p1 TRINITY_DN11842_c0_g1~~TRINITY_DN11842_c0_g1_i17.p1  ORF type:complete len:146 (+),score=17.96 TRINITY_DN11842_c0_g1_i17:332-769(+)